MGYTEKYLVQMCEKALSNAATFYQKDFINYRGKTEDTDEYYTEIIARFLLEHIDAFKNNIPMISRTQGYNMHHDGNYDSASNREEEITAMKLFNLSKVGKSFESVGKIIDYQTPLKAKKCNVAGKMDLLSFDGKQLQILELKKKDSTETLLRCVLEGYTYLKTVDKELLCDSFKDVLCDDCGGFLDFPISAAPLVYYKGSQWNEWQEHRPMLRKLMQELDSVPYFLLEKDEGYEIVEE